MKFKIERFTNWLKQAYRGCFNIRLHVDWMITARARQTFDPEYFEKAVLSLASDLLRRGVVNVHQVYDIGYDAFVFRASLKETFDSRKVH
jgi:hypothetical protein